MRQASVRIFRGRRRSWYWQLRAINGKVIADGGEGYSRQDAARRAVLRALAICRRLTVADVRTR